MESTMKSGWSNGVLMVFGVVWAVSIALGFLVLWGYQSTAGDPGSPTTQWPGSSHLLPEKGRAHLVMAAHPHCACTRASIESLARIMAHARGRGVATVLFLKPRDTPTGWDQTDLWRSAAAIPGVRVVCDEGGVESSLFGLETSGHTLLFDQEGRLRFSGGITAGRGHHGDNAGLEQCIALLNGTGTDKRHTPVFGCPLHAHSTVRAAGDEVCRTTN
jgi:hypothetical protein